MQSLRPGRRGPRPSLYFYCRVSANQFSTTRDKQGLAMRGREPTPTALILAIAMRRAVGPLCLEVVNVLSPCCSESSVVVHCDMALIVRLPCTPVT